MAAPVSFQGLTTGIQTDQLIAAILGQEGQGVQRLLDRQAFNKIRTTAIQSVRSGANALSTSLAALLDKFNARTVASTDSNSVYVSATANGAPTGNYDLNVATVATRGRIAPTLSGGVPTNLAVADPAAAIFSSAKASFAVQGTDGVIKTFELTNNSLNGLRDAINASGAGVTASVINAGTGATPYQLVLTAKETGTGTTSGVVTFAAIDNKDASATVVNPALGITAGAITGTFGTPTGLSGGLSNASDPAKDAVFTLNGIQLTRKTNVVTDAVDGVIFTLKQGGQTGTTTLTVAQDKVSATSGLQDVLSKYNALLKTFNAAAASSKDPDTGAVIKGALSGDDTIKSLLSQVRAALTGTIAGPSGSTTITSLNSLGVSTGVDGALSLNTSTFQAALDKDPTAAKNLFIFAGSSTSGVVALKESTSKTSTGAVTFNITSYVSGGAVAGTFNYGGTDYYLTGSNGTLTGATGTPLEGLTVSVLGTGTGTLNLTRGGGQTARDLLSRLTTAGTGDISLALANINNQNTGLNTQIEQGNTRLARRKLVLKSKFAKLEVDIASMKAAVGGLGGLG